MKRYLALCVMLLVCAGAQAQTLQPFVRGSQQAILAKHQGRPFVLALWSLDCVYCPQELALLGGLLAQHRDLAVVLVSTDTLQQSADIEAVLKQHRLERVSAWVFADTFVERLRHEIDPRWYGELPRTYFHAADGTVIAVSGVLDEHQVEHWIEAQHRRK